jgi:uncharacterized protein
MVNIRYQFSKSWTVSSPAAVQTQSAPDPVQSPCIGVCELDAQGLCRGCFRTGAEIGGWLSYSDAERAQLMDVVLPQREAEYS